MDTFVLCGLLLVTGVSLIFFDPGVGMFPLFMVIGKTIDIVFNI
jgi:hypothetical protein